MVFSITSRSGDGASPVSARRFRLSLPALLVLSGAGLYGSTAMAAFLPPPTGSGQLNNQLRQQDRTVPPAPVAPSISLPAGEHGSARAPESTARVTLKA
ncbi:TPA: hypothetical protein ACIO89_005530, partial [Salmonella enterica subsp. enterica serovar Java]